MGKQAKIARLASTQIYGRVLTGSVETALLWLNDGFDIGTGFVSK